MEPAFEIPEGAPWPADFHRPNWEGDIDIERHINRIPRRATARGVFAMALRDEAERRGRSLPLPRRYFAFKNYPLREMVALTAAAARTIHPEVPIKQAIGRIGRLAYGSFRQTMAGRVIFDATRPEVHQVLRLGSRAASIASSEGRIELIECDDVSARVRVEDIHIFADCFCCGMGEGVLIACDRPGYVLQRMESPTCGELFIYYGPLAR